MSADRSAFGRRRRLACHEGRAGRAPVRRPRKRPCRRDAELARRIPTRRRDCLGARSRARGGSGWGFDDRLLGRSPQSDGRWSVRSMSPAPWVTLGERSTKRRRTPGGDARMRSVPPPARGRRSVTARAYRTHSGGSRWARRSTARRPERLTTTRRPRPRARPGRGERVHPDRSGPDQRRPSTFARSRFATRRRASEGSDPEKLGKGSVRTAATLPDGRVVVSGFGLRENRLAIRARASSILGTGRVACSSQRRPGSASEAEWCSRRVRVGGASGCGGPPALRSQSSFRTGSVRSAVYVVGPLAFVTFFGRGAEGGSRRARHRARRKAHRSRAPAPRRWSADHRRLNRGHARRCMDLLTVGLPRPWAPMGRPSG